MSHFNDRLDEIDDVIDDDEVDDLLECEMLEAVVEVECDEIDYKQI